MGKRVRRRGEGPLATEPTANCGTRNWTAAEQQLSRSRGFARALWTSCAGATGGSSTAATRSAGRQPHRRPRRPSAPGRGGSHRRGRTTTTATSPCRTPRRLRGSPPTPARPAGWGEQSGNSTPPTRSATAAIDRGCGCGHSPHPPTAADHSRHRCAVQIGSRPSFVVEVGVDLAQ